MRNTRIPVGAGIFITGINIVVAIIITPHVGYSGLALSLSLSTAVEALILIVALSWKMGRFDAEFGAWFARVVLATAIMGCGALLLSNYLIDRMNSGNMNRLVSMFFMGYAMMLAAGIYFAAAFALRLEETGRWLSMARRMSMKVIGRTPFARS
jgi:peptidoglycan biosynthesis protein MviN/MurJ (putative lipid II flippase)